MALTYADVEGWFGFTCDAAGALFPTDAQVTAFLAVAATDFEAFTEQSFDDTISKHLALYMNRYMAKRLHLWYKMRMAMGEASNVGGVSITHPFSQLVYNDKKLDDLEDDVKHSRTASDAVGLYFNAGSYANDR